MSINHAHALDATELAALRQRHPPARTDIRLAIWPKIPDAVVWEARVTLPLPASDDMVYEINYDGGGAGFGNTIRDQTVWIGSTARSYDRGVVRLRATAPGVAGVLEIAENSEVVWTDDDYITVIDDFNLWPRPVYLNPGGTIFMDRDIAYTDQHLYPDPVPILLSDIILEYDGVLGGANTVDALFDASDSWALDGGALTYSWTAPGASATAGMATATPAVTYNAAGTFRVSCTVSRDYGGGNIKTFTGYRYVHVFDDDNLPVYSFTLDSCSGDWSSGGWSFTVTMDDDAKRSEIVERAKVILFANDNITSPGPIKSDTHGVLRANILAIGWIVGETIHYNNEKGNVEFEVQGPAHWFDLMTAFPHGLEDYNGAPTSWLEFDNLDVRSGDWSWLHWRTTATRCMDVYVPIADSRQIRQYAAPGSSSLWDQITRVNESTILAHPCCDRYGTLWIRRPLSLLFLAERAGIVTVMEILKQDWREQIDITRRIVDEVSMLDASGIGYLNATVDPYYMLVLGHIYKRYGSVESHEKLALFTNQATNNTLAGLLFDYMNNEYPTVDIRTAGDYRVVDIAPSQRLTLSIAEDDTERGIVWTEKQLVPMSVMFTHDSASAVLDVDIACEAETFGVEGITGDPPPEKPEVPVEPPPPLIPPIEPPPPPVASGVVILNKDQVAISFDFFDNTPCTWYDLDPLGNLVGVFQMIAVTGDGQAYVTTRDDLDQANTGLFHCPDITLAVTSNNVWNLIKSPVNAAADTGYTTGGARDCCFGSIYVNDADQVCALVHSVGGTAPLAPGSGAYIGSGASVAISLFGLVGGSYFFQQQPPDQRLHSVYGGAGSWYIAGRTATARAYLAVGPAWAFTDYWTATGEGSLCAAGGDIGGYTIGGTGQVYSGWAPTLIAGLIIVRASGIEEDLAGTHRLYIEDDGNSDLYQDGILIGDASTAASGFGAGGLGGMAMFQKASSIDIVWIAGNSRSFVTDRAVIYSLDGGASWIDKTSGLSAALGSPTWSGWSGSATGNSIIRVFDY